MLIHGHEVGGMGPWSHRTLFRLAPTHIKSPWRDGFVCTLDVAKAFSLVPHPLLFYLMERLGWYNNVLWAFQESLMQTTCTCQVGEETV